MTSAIMEAPDFRLTDDNFRDTAADPFYLQVSKIGYNPLDAEAKARMRTEADWEGQITYRRPGRDYEQRYGMPLSNSIDGKLYLTRTSFKKATGLRSFPDNFSAWNELAEGEFYQARMQKHKRGRTQYEFLEFIRTATAEEYAAAEAAAVKPSADGAPALSAAVMGISPEEAVLELLESIGGSGSQKELRDALNGSDHKANPAVAGGIFSGELLDAMVSAGQLTKDGRVYARA